MPMTLLLLLLLRVIIRERLTKRQLDVHRLDIIGMVLAALMSMQQIQHLPFRALTVAELSVMCAYTRQHIMQVTTTAQAAAV